MPKTISFHNGTEWSRGHNIRDQRYTAKQIHIDKTLNIAASGFQKKLVTIFLIYNLCMVVTVCNHL